MKRHAMLLTLLLVPNLSAKHNQVNPQPTKESIELQKQEEADSTKIKLALIAAAVSILVLWKGNDASEAISFDKLIMLLWKK